jgi:predicted RNA-binding Zn ribbon-like protein
MAPLQPADPPEPAAGLWIANARWLDFVNTRYVVRGQPREVLTTFEALVQWLVEAGLLRADDAAAFVARWRGTPEARSVLGEAHALRDTLRDMAEALARGSDVPAAAVDACNRVLRAGPTYTQLAPTADGPHGLARTVRAMGVDPLWVLMPVADSAAEVLCGVVESDRVRRCDNPKCVLYFHDTTKNRHRRFCSASGCGNRAKAAARYRRLRDAERDDASRPSPLGPTVD